MNKVYKDVLNLADKYERLWWLSPATMPILPKISNEDKLKREVNMAEIIVGFNEMIDKIPKDKKDIPAWQNEFKQKVSKHANGSLGIQNKEFEKAILTSCTDSAQKFINSARRI